jgi:hypothetical protein
MTFAARHQSIPAVQEYHSERVTFRSGLFRGLLWVQGVYYFITGIWPLLSIRTFQMVTGPKTDHLTTGRQADHWLVMTVGVLICSIAITLLVAAWRKSFHFELAILALTAAAALTGIDIFYVARGAIAKIYLLDAALEIPLILAWAFILCRWNGMKNGDPAR